MKKIFFVFCLFAVIGARPITVFSAEYQGSDFLPKIRYLVFGQNEVGFVSIRLPYVDQVDYFGSNVFYFVYDRGNHKVVEVDAKQFQQRFPSGAPKDNPTQAPSEPYIAGHTSNGIEYRYKMKYCGEGVTDDLREVVVNNRNIRIQSRDECTSVSSVEILDNQLWLGTAYSGEAGESAAEGVIVQDVNNETALARITNLSGPIVRIQADPVSKNVWVITADGIYEISRQFKILSINLSYQDFNSVTGLPHFAFADKITHGNPFSVVSRWLPIVDRKSFYEAVKKIPAADVKLFSLYDFYMCCDPSRPNYPASFRIMSPFLIKASNALKANGSGEFSRSLAQALCRMGDPATEQYCK